MSSQADVLNVVIMKFRLKLLLAAILISSASPGLFRWVNRAFIIHNSSYYQLLSDFRQAQSRELSKLPNGLDGWNFQVTMPEKQLSVWVRAASQPGVVRIQYENEPTEIELYTYSDYSAPIEIRLAGHLLYVHWHEPLFRPTRKILAFDLAAHKEITRRRIDPNDLGQSR